MTDRFICDDCAERRGAVWPYGKVYVARDAICICCQENDFMTYVDAWQWPFPKIKHGGMA